jgi:hypothetical protein
MVWHVCVSQVKQAVMKLFGGCLYASQVLFHVYVYVHMDVSICHSHVYMPAWGHDACTYVLHAACVCEFVCVCVCVCVCVRTRCWGAARHGVCMSIYSLLHACVLMWYAGVLACLCA